LLVAFNVKVGREDILKTIIGNDSSYEVNNDNEVGVVHFETSKILIVNSTIYKPRHS